ncbi:NAD(P)H-binding protein [uncultured Amnibacterium sp.]|uniref:NAD(P)H-binding protein n=1 Tax=uncultured Amnibacterium sp. TaxID=1631851 RepID=UPI0035CC24F6
MSPEDGLPQDARDEHGARRVLVLGANGPTGREVVQQALHRGLAVTALTRNQASFPIVHERIDVVGGDATDPSTIDAVVARADAVVSVIGTAYTWKPVTVYSRSARELVDAMRQHGGRRLIVVTSMAVPKQETTKNPLRTLLLRLWRSTYTRTLYDDMLEMERIVSTSGLDWTIVRPPALTYDPASTYAIADTRIDLPAMARADLAAMLLDQLDDHEWIRRTAGVATRTSASR